MLLVPAICGFSPVFLLQAARSELSAAKRAALCRAVVSVLVDL